MNPQLFSLIFLSRLCGGEFFNLAKIKIRKFLSRLCGGECALPISMNAAFFLSRLCGGEYAASAKTTSFIVSKPPVWR